MIPKRNYLFVSLIFIFTIVAVVVSFILYKNIKEYNESIPVIRDYVKEINYDDLNNYFLENDDFFLYIGVASDDNCREFEEDLKGIIKERNISNIIYLNIANIKDKDKFYDEINSKYSSNTKLSNYPAFIIVKNKKILDLVQRNDYYLNIDEVQKLFDYYEIDGDLND